MHTGTKFIQYCTVNIPILYIIYLSHSYQKKDGNVSNNKSSLQKLFKV